MKRILRLIAIAIAVAAVLDPALSRRTTVPLPVAVVMPPASDPNAESARAVRATMASELEGHADLDGSEEPLALLAFGRADVPSSLRVPLFAIGLHDKPAVSIEKTVTPPAIPGQIAPVLATVHGNGLSGRTTSIALERNGAGVDVIQHKWTSDSDRFTAQLAFVPHGAGVHRVRVTATTSGVESPATADVAVVARERRLRVLAYEARPSWPLTFVRRSLEAEPLFDVQATVRTTGRLATIYGDAPGSLAALSAERFDVVLVGSPEALTAAEIRALDTFVSSRGGSLLLLPDRAITDSVRRSFGLPEFDEVILERPLATSGPGSGPTLRVSELLLSAREGDGAAALAAVRHGGADRAVVTTLMRGAGRIIVSGALDAWRYRADPEAAFDAFWRGLVADAAAAAPPRVAVHVDPSVACPGDEITVSVSLRPSEFDDRGTIEMPAITAELASGAGDSDMIRLWPVETPGTFTGRIRAPRAGVYTASVKVAGASADAPLLIAEDVVHAARDSERALAFAAAATGGAVVTDVEDLKRHLDAIAPADVERRIRPMRSPWWLLPFAGALCLEWALRRRGGGR